MPRKPRARHTIETSQYFKKYLRPWKKFLCKGIERKNNDINYIVDLDNDPEVIRSKWPTYSCCRGFGHLSPEKSHSATEQE